MTPKESDGDFQKVITSFLLVAILALFGYLYSDLRREVTELKSMVYAIQDRGSVAFRENLAEDRVEIKALRGTVDRIEAQIQRLIDDLDNHKRVTEPKRK